MSGVEKLVLNGYILFMFSVHLSTVFEAVLQKLTTLLSRVFETVLHMVTMSLPALFKEEIEKLAALLFTILEAELQREVMRVFLDDFNSAVAIELKFVRVSIADKVAVTFCLTLALTL